jgi:hypothetical protein
MDPVRHKTQKNTASITELSKTESSKTELSKTELSKTESSKTASSKTATTYQYDTDDKFKNLLETSARDAYSRAWHRIERGLRLNRMRIFIQDVSEQYAMTEKERIALFDYLQDLLDKKHLNTLKVVIYDQTKQRIVTIKGLDLKRTEEGVLTWDFNTKKVQTTRKKKKEDAPSVSTQSNKIDEEENKEDSELKDIDQLELDDEIS